MAGPASDFQLPSASFFNIYADAPLAPLASLNAPLAPLAPASPSLPGGPCNYVDLTPGASGQKCGCRRFWSRASFAASERDSPARFPPGLANGYDTQAPWCMCSHHACFHDDARESQTPVPNASASYIPTNGQENEPPRTNREPLTPVVLDPCFDLAHSAAQEMDPNVATNIDSFSRELGQDPRLGELAEPSLPDTLAWAGLIPSDPKPPSSLPPIPSQCLMPSQPSSTTSSARIAYLKPFGGKGLHTLSGARSKLREPLQEQMNVPEPRDEDTVEHDTDPSVDDGQTVANTPQSTRHKYAVDELDQSPAPRINRGALSLLSNTVRAHEQRIEDLESISFSAAAHDACHEKHDHADLRATELELRVEEVERMLNDNASHASIGYSRSRHERTERIDDATASIVSGSTNAGSYIMDRADLQRELETLKSRLYQLQGFSSFPSLTQHWEVEVVFLPFPLKNVWLESRDFGSLRLSHGNPTEADLWTQMPSSPEPLSPGFSDWVGPEIESDWLLGRACAPDNMIGQRLRSRGLVKNVTIRGPDARSVQEAMSTAFGTLFRTFSRMQANVHHGSTIHPRVAKFLGLQSPWVPLRKIHKDSRLHFLTPAEMVTPVSWDVQFLASSVVMKAHDIHRLFITHPEAYLQDQHAYENGWTWQRLRELSRVYADSQNSQEILEGDAKEECWAWNTILDTPLAANSHHMRAHVGQASAQDYSRPWSTVYSSRNGFADVAATASQLATRRYNLTTKSPSPFPERRASKTPRIRTVSMPPALPALVSPAIAKRRITPNGPPNERYSSPRPARVVPIAALAKRRSTRSPSLRPRLNRFTPRWSTSSPSPVPEMLVPRGTTPFYATPHSNAPAVDARVHRGDMDVVDDDIDFDPDATESGVDSGSDIDVYEDEAIANYHLEGETDDDDSSMEDFAYDSYQAPSHESWQDGQGPEDEPWPGIEDVENRDPDATIRLGDDAMTDVSAGSHPTAINTDEHETQSQASSGPSEYPSNEPPWGIGGEDQEPNARALESK
ncbi:hypothetical protein F5Y14DRAFT_215439 [Nemania sp. NC0429]|nr:hypothetical protein F5Y14DRAFT_215439 [Nemania sp. NC0429]